MWKREALSEGIDRRQLAWGLGLTGPSVCDVSRDLSLPSLPDGQRMGLD